MLSQEAKRDALVRQAFWLEWATVGWMIVEAAIAMMAGLAARSLTLIAFGLDSVIELASAGVLLWRLTIELRRGREFPESVEKRARRIAALLLFVLAAYVVFIVGWSLWRHQGAEFSLPGLILAMVALPLMYWLSR